MATPSTQKAVLAAASKQQSTPAIKLPGGGTIRAPTTTPTAKPTVEQVRGAVTNISAAIPTAQQIKERPAAAATLLQAAGVPQMETSPIKTQAAITSYISQVNKQIEQQNQAVQTIQNKPTQWGFVAQPVSNVPVTVSPVQTTYTPSLAYKAAGVLGYPQRIIEGIKEGAASLIKTPVQVRAQTPLSMIVPESPIRKLSKIPVPLPGIQVVPSSTPMKPGEVKLIDTTVGKVLATEAYLAAPLASQYVAVPLVASADLGITSNWLKGGIKTVEQGGIKALPGAITTQVKEHPYKTAAEAAALILGGLYLRGVGRTYLENKEWETAKPEMFIGKRIESPKGGVDVIYAVKQTEPSGFLDTLFGVRPQKAVTEIIQPFYKTDYGTVMESGKGYALRTIESGGAGDFQTAAFGTSGRTAETTAVPRRTVDFGAGTASTELNAQADVGRLITTKTAEQTGTFAIVRRPAELGGDYLSISGKTIPVQEVTKTTFGGVSNVQDDFINMIGGTATTMRVSTSTGMRTVIVPAEQAGRLTKVPAEDFFGLSSSPFTVSTEGAGGTAVSQIQTGGEAVAQKAATSAAAPSIVKSAFEQIPKLVQKGSALVVIPVAAQEATRIITGQTQTQQQKQQQRNKVTQILTPSTTETIGQKVSNVPLISVTTTPIERTVSVVTPITLQVPSEKLITSPIQLVSQVPKLKTEQITTSIPRFDFVIPPKNIPIAIFSKKERLIKRSRVKILGKAYKTLLKRRGKFFEIGRGLPRAEAIKRGERAALGTLARTFKIEEMKAPALLPSSEYRPSAKLFREYKISKGTRIPLKDTFIQRRGLDTRSEVREILLAKRGKARRTKLI